MLTEENNFVSLVHFIPTLPFHSKCRCNLSSSPSPKQLSLFKAVMPLLSQPGEGAGEHSLPNGCLGTFVPQNANQSPFKLFCFPVIPPLYFIPLLIQTSCCPLYPFQLTYYKCRQIIYPDLFRCGILLRRIHLLFGKDLTSPNLKHEFRYLRHACTCLKVP